MKRYEIQRASDHGSILVVVEEPGGSRRPLDSRLDLCRHSPTGFEIGYGGSGPAQLALALLADATGDAELSIEAHQSFKWSVIAGLDRKHPRHVLTDGEILEWLRSRGYSVRGAA